MKGLEEVLGADQVRLERIVWSWASDDHRSRMVLHRDRHLVWANGAARELLAQGEHLTVSNGIVSAHAHEQAEFARFCLDLRARASHCIAIASLPVLVIEGVPTVDDLLVLTCQLRSAGERRWAPFEAVFGLTPSEHRVITALLDGEDVGSFAMRSGISVLTARTHVRRAYAKIGVSNREQLFRVLIVFRLD